MKAITHGLALLLLASAWATAEDRATPPAIVERYCSGCHGTNGQSELPYIPKLAGQNSVYLEHKLADFGRGRSRPVDEILNRLVQPKKDDGSIRFTDMAGVHMVGVANAMAEGDREAAVQWYSSQEPAHGKGSQGRSIDVGRKLYASGLEVQHVPACQSCHGSQAQGTKTAPRLAGQNAAYLVSQLSHFRSGDVASSPMVEVARSLEKNQVRTIAAFLQSQ